jgi:CBS domain-containing protein
MTVGVVTCSQQTSIQVVAQAILEKGVEAVVVLDQEGHAVGIVGQDELVRIYHRGDYGQLTALDVMTDGMPQIPPDIAISAAAQMMQDQGVRIYYLTHRAGGIEYPAAYISYTHLIRHIAMQTEEDIKDLGISAARKSPIEVFEERKKENIKKNQTTHLT